MTDPSRARAKSPRDFIAWLNADATRAAMDAPRPWPSWSIGFGKAGRLERVGRSGMVGLPPSGADAVGAAGPGRRGVRGLGAGADAPPVVLPEHPLAVPDAGAGGGAVGRVELAEDAGQDEVAAGEDALDLGVGERPGGRDRGRPAGLPGRRQDRGDADVRSPLRQLDRAGQGGPAVDVGDGGGDQAGRQARGKLVGKLLALWAYG